MRGVEAAGASASAVPFYPGRHSGTALVCGFGPGFYDDLAEAQRLRPDAQAIAVNESAKAVKAFALFTLHPEKGKRWKALARQSFGETPPLHSGGESYHVENRQKRFPLVDHWWRDAAGGGTSVWAAAKMARLMGFEEIILVGMPLVHGNYADKSFAKMFREGQKREDGRDMLQAYRDYVINDTSWHEGVSSMSGFTRDVFGPPA